MKANATAKNNHQVNEISANDKGDPIPLTAHLASIWQSLPTDRYVGSAELTEIMTDLGRPVPNNLSATLYELRQRKTVDCKSYEHGGALRWIYRRPIDVAITITHGHPKGVRYKGMPSKRGKDKNDAGYAKRLVKPKEPCNTGEQQEMDIPKPAIDPKLTELSQQIAASLTQMMDGAAGVESAISELVRATQQFPSFMEMRAENERLKAEVERLQDELNTRFPGEDGLLVERVTAEVMKALEGKANG